MSEPKTLAEKLAKLPAWAQEHIKTLQRERDVAVRELTEFLDNQKPSRVFTEHYIAPCIGELRPSQERVYVHPDYAVVMEAHDIRVRLTNEHGSTNNESICLQWEDIGRKCRDVALVPLSYNMVRLITKARMR